MHRAVPNVSGIFTIRLSCPLGYSWLRGRQRSCNALQGIKEVLFTAEISARSYLFLKQIEAPITRQQCTSLSKGNKGKRNWSSCSDTPLRWHPARLPPLKELLGQTQDSARSRIKRKSAGGKGPSSFSLLSSACTKPSPQPWNQPLSRKHAPTYV